MAFGALLSGISGNNLGRRGALEVDCSIAIVGAAGMLGTAGKYTAYIACKFIGAVGIGQIQTLGLIYGVEVTPPSRQGLLITLFGIGQSMGNLVVACVCLGSSQLKSDSS